MDSRFATYKKTDPILAAAVTGLTLFGILMVYSASSYAAKNAYGNEYYFLIKQAVGAALGLAAMAACSFVDYRVLIKLRYPLLAVSYLMLVLVFVPHIGVENYGAKRWINLPFFTIQASEIAKFGFIVFSAAYMAKNYRKMTSFRALLPVLISEPNMSVTMCVGLTMFVMLFVGGAKIKHLALLLIPAVALVPVLIVIEPYRLHRLTAFLDPWASPLGEGYQLIQSFYALGSGGLFGVGLFNSRQKYLFLPFGESDFIFSVIGEEFGFVGSALVIAVYVILIFRIVRIAKNAPDRFGCYLSAGIAAIIAIQTAINVAVVSGSIPPTGLPLPFVSSGSSSLIVFCASVGFVFSVERRSHDSVKCLVAQHNRGNGYGDKRIGKKEKHVVSKAVPERGKAGKVAVPDHKVYSARPEKNAGKHVT